MSNKFAAIAEKMQGEQYERKNSKKKQRKNKLKLNWKTMLR